MSKFDKTVGGVNFLVFDGRVTARSGEEFQALTLDDIGNLSQFCAVAWEALAGEGYKPVIISERGYVADAGKIVETKYGPTDSVYDDGDGLERDCE